MARIYAGNDGVIMRWDNFEEIRAAPPGGTRVVDYDPDYNAPVTALLRGAWTNLRVPANGQLTNSGSPVTINPASENYRDRQDLDQAISNLQAFYALVSGTATNAQQDTAIKSLTQILRYIFRAGRGRLF